MSGTRTIEFIDAHLGTMRTVFGTLFALGGVFFISLLLSTVHIDTTSPTTVATTESKQTVVVSSDDPNVIASGMTDAGDKLKHGLEATGVTLTNGSRSAVVGVVKGATFVVDGGATLGHATVSGTAFVGRSIGNSVIATGRGIGNSAVFLIRIPGTVVGLVPDVTNVSAIINPASQVAVPVIEPTTGVLLATQTAMTVAQPVAQQTPAATAATPIIDSDGAWPLRGSITTLFGVPELPYQAVHTGLDISDGKRPGTTPVRAFKSGHVTQAIQSSFGLGNHVVIDHGSGVTSVYGHLNSLSVQVGQQVDKTTVLGYEGSTGVSTGSHLHFEIRVNGQPNDPHKFISGQPY